METRRGTHECARHIGLPSNVKLFLREYTYDRFIAHDPKFVGHLTQPFIVNYHFKKLPDGSRW